MGRAVQLMAELSEEYAHELGGLRKLMGAETTPNWDTPKISRGENYQGLPYVILDQPRLFTKEHILAIRTMFWWGHYFIATLHLAGEVKAKYSQTLISGWQVLAAAQFQIYVREEDPWQHDFENGNYRLISAMPASEFERLIHRLPFIKIAKSYPLEGWEELIPGVVKDYQLLLQLLVSHQ